MAPRAKPSWSALGSLLLIIMATGGGIGWRLRVQAIDGDIKQKHSALKRLHLTGKIPPNREVLDYLKARTSALEVQYQSALKLVTSMPLGVGGQANAQLYFQQQFHEVQRALERLATARGMAAPTQLGFPKELPPADAVPRLLVQLGLIEDAAGFIVAQGVSQLVSVKVEDPQAVAAVGEEKAAFLTRLPVRIRLACSLEALIRILGIFDRAKPLIDLQSLRLSKPADSEELDVELIVARYLMTKPDFEQPKEAPSPEPAGRTKTSS